MSATPKNLKELTALSEKLKWAEQKWDNIFFPVKEETNVIQGVNTGKKTLYRIKNRGDNKKIEIISTVGENYQIVTNEWLHEAIQAYSKMLKLNLKLSNCIRNRKTVIIYDIRNKKDQNININNDEDGNYFVKLLIENSYDGTTYLEFKLAIVREICSNGMTIPHGEVYKLKQRHIGINFEKFQHTVHEFLKKILSTENFQKTIEKINTMKNETPHVDFNFLKSLPLNQSLPIIEGLKNYSTCVDVIYQNEKYNVNQHLNHEIIKNLLLANKAKTDIAKKRMETEEAKIKLMEYNEKIINQWTLFQFIIKLISLKVKQNRRFNAVKKIASNF